MLSSADLVQAAWELGLSDEWWLKGIQEVLDRLPADIAAEFDCVRGPHEYLEVTAVGVTWAFCKHCKRKKVIRPWVDMRLPVGGSLPGFWGR